jgi:hypothetical protein
VAVFAAVISLGPSVMVGHAHVLLLWHALGTLPLVRLATPGRTVMYVVLAGAVAIALVGSERGRALQRAARWALVAVALVSMLPNVTGQVWSAREPDPRFFATGAYHGYLHPDDTVVIVWTRKGDQMYWQARTHFAFRLAGGYLGVTPPGVTDSGFAKRLAAGQVGPGQTAKLQAFVTAHHVSAILVLHAPQRALDAIAKAFGVTPRVVGGVTVYRVTP